MKRNHDFSHACAEKRDCGFKAASRSQRRYLAAS